MNIISTKLLLKDVSSLLWIDSQYRRKVSHTAVC